MVSILTEKSKNDFSLLCKWPESAIAKAIYLSAPGGFIKQKLKTFVLSTSCYSDMGHRGMRRSGPYGACCWQTQIQNSIDVWNCHEDVSSKCPAWTLFTGLAQQGTRVVWFHRHLLLLFLTQEHLNTHMDMGITLDNEKLFVVLWMVQVVPSAGHRVMRQGHTWSLISPDQL